MRISDWSSDVCSSDLKVVGVIANNPQTGGGALSAEACRKIVDFTVMCDSFNIPLVRLMDTPGFVVGTDAERRGAPGHIMNFMNATRSEEHTSELQSLMRTSYAVSSLNKTKHPKPQHIIH